MEGLFTSRTVSWTRRGVDDHRLCGRDRLTQLSVQLHNLEDRANHPWRKDAKATIATLKSGARPESPQWEERLWMQEERKEENQLDRKEIWLGEEPDMDGEPMLASKFCVS